jgi:general secretion pathway protein A
MGDGYEQHFGLRWRAFEPAAGAAPAQLRPEEVEPYLVERLRAAGWQGTPMLDLGLAPLLHEATGGEREIIDRAMTALLEEAARADSTVIAGDGLAAWLDRDGNGNAEVAPTDAPGLAEAQLDAIEGAFAEHDRKLARLRRELAELRDHSGTAAAPAGLEGRLHALEARIDQQEAALRHVLERLIAFFEREGPG